MQSNFSQQLRGSNFSDAQLQMQIQIQIQRYIYTFHSSSSVQCICLRIVSRFLYFFGHVSVVYLSQPSSLFGAFFFSVFFFVSSFSISSISYYCLCLVLLKQSLQFCRLQWLLLCQCCCCFVAVAVCCLLLPLSSLHSAPFSAFHLNEISGDSTKQS